MVFIKDINLSLNILIKILFLKLSFLSVLIAPVVESLTTSNIEGDEYFVAFALFNGTDILEDRDELVPTEIIVRGKSPKTLLLPVKFNYKLC